MKNYEKGKHLVAEDEKEYVHEEFFGVIKKARARIKRDKCEGALMGEYNANFTKFLLTNHYGMEDKQSRQHTGKDSGPIELEHKFDPVSASIELLSDD